MTSADAPVLPKSYLNEVTASHARLTRRGMLQSAIRGRHSGPVPPGYLPDDHRRGVPVPDPAQSSAVREAFALALSGLSLRQILPRVRALSLTGRDGSPVSLATLARVLSNPFYAGSVRHNGKSYHGLHKPIVSEQDFHRVQVMMAKRRCS
jgi:site-specific DNA recombinase